MAAAGPLLHVWKEWGLQVLLLLSFIFQVALLILAELRRSLDSSVLRALVWSAYMLADATAIYVLGHMSVTSRLAEHELTMFWAPFLLLHLGGQDNITAYAIEDNRLWLRHLQTLAVQVAGAAYVIYVSRIFHGSRPSLLWWATILMFAVGVIKYGERVWALRCAGRTQSGTNYRSLERRQYVSKALVKDGAMRITDAMDAGTFVLMAHWMLRVPMDLLLERVSHDDLQTDLAWEEAYKVVEMQLSLMHDVFYTKTEVMHTWHGFCVRMISLPATAVALFLFHSLDDSIMNSYSKFDVAVTYVLLVGAVLVEITSVVRVLFSSWTCTALLARWSEFQSGGIWYFLARVVLSVHRIVDAIGWRRSHWCRSMGQHNLLRLCAGSKNSRRSRIAGWMGLEDWWNTLSYSWSIPVSEFIEQLVVKELQKNGRPRDPDHIINLQLREVLKRRGLDEEPEELDWTVEESILVWHIATDLYLRCYKEKQQKATGRQDGELAELAQAAEELSNYLLFLLAARPYMLPSSVDRNAYVQMCYSLLSPKEALRCWKGLPSLDYRSADDLASSLRRLGDALNTGSTKIHQESTTPVDGRSDSAILITGAQLGSKLISEEQSTAGHMLELIVQEWVGILFYVGSRCSAYSHARQLSDGGDLATVVAILLRYITHITQGITTDP
uniref:DUF4220 domain-containing protein n=1 Tax=Oryza punctata TaxID=4537 RepID=A0A0E0MN51_ORYPU